MNFLKTACMTIGLLAMTTAAQATAIKTGTADFTIDTTAQFDDFTGPTTFARGNGFLAPGASLSFTPKGSGDPDAVVSSPLDLKFDFREQHNHTGGVFDGRLTLSKGDKSVEFGTVEAAKGFSTSAFEGEDLFGDWVLTFDSGTGPDPWTSFGGGGSFAYTVGAVPGGGGTPGGGGSVPVPASLLFVLVGLGGIGVAARRRALAKV